MADGKKADGHLDYCAVLQALYDSEINWAIVAIYDGGFLATLGADDVPLEELMCDSVIEAAEALKDAALKHYPNSEFAQRFRSS